MKRRDFLLTSASAIALPAAAGFAQTDQRSKPRHKVERLGIGVIGLRYQGSVVCRKAEAHGDVVAVCDVDSNVLDQAKSSFGERPPGFTDYRDLLKRKDVDVVIIATPDHWHAKMLIDACRAGKDVYVEKPLTLTVDEGKLIRNVAKETGRIIQVGSWQRSDEHYRLAVEMVRAGRIGKLERVEIALAKNKVGGPFPVCPVPRALDWDRWQGQTPEVPYIEQRAHFNFRWWYEYAGGKMTDWGAHHIDIGQWATDSDPVEVHGEANLPNVSSDSFNVAIDFNAWYRFANGVEMTVSDTGRNGVMFIGSKGRMFANRGVIAGKAVEELNDKPMSREEFQLYDFDNDDRPARTGKMEAIINHVGNFFDCVVAGKTPISDVESQNRSANTCHIANISMRLGRPLKWDPTTEEFVGDDEANGMLSREQRRGYEVV
jgi:myo-inositol 2-dehydrogenase/D-chiro-inositol 1-dehydrogenase